MSDRDVALVTGASRGIGAATARRLAAAGKAVILVARSAPGLAEVEGAIRAEGGEAVALPTDLTDRSAVESLAETVQRRFGTLSLLVNNAGVLPEARRLERITRDEWDRALLLNVTVPWYLSCRAKELMSPEGGVVVNVASTASFYPSVGLGPYNVSKAALVMLTRVCALEWARDNVRVVGVAPGKIDTAMVQPILDYVDQCGGSLNPLGRVGRPEEVAELIAFLAGPRATFISGSVVTIDGAETAGLAV